MKRRDQFQPELPSSPDRTSGVCPGLIRKARAGVEMCARGLRILACCVIAAGIQSGCTTGSSAQPPRTVNLALVADPHTSIETKHADYNEHYEAVIRAVNNAGVDLVLLAGDLTNHGRTDEFAGYQELTGGFDAPVYAVAGNHDVGSKVMPNKDPSMSADRLARYETTIGPLFYTQVIADGIRLVAATSSLMGSGMPPEDEQWVFLEEHLPAARGEFVLLMMHYPLYVDTPDEPAGYMNLDPGPRRRLTQLLKQSGVTLVLCGHQHRPMDKIDNGLRMITAPPVSFGLPRGKQREGWTLIRIDTNGRVTADIRYLPETQGSAAP